MNNRAYPKTPVFGMLNFNRKMARNPNGWMDFQSVNASELVFLRSTKSIFTTKKNRKNNFTVPLIITRFEHIYDCSFKNDIFQQYFHKNLYKYSARNYYFLLHLFLFFGIENNNRYCLNPFKILVIKNISCILTQRKCLTPSISIDILYFIEALSHHEGMQSRITY